MYYLSNNQPIDTREVKAGLDDNSYGTCYFLNTKTGEVEVIVTEAMDNAEEELERVEADDDLVGIPGLPSWQKYNWMQDFVEEVVKDKDQHMYEKLLIALDGKGAFGRFKNVLHWDEDLLQVWYNWEDECLEKEMEEWFEGLDVDIRKE